MPGKPTRTTPETTLYRDGTTGRTLPATATPGAQRRSTDATVEQIDRRLARVNRDLDWLAVGPDSPGLNTGKAWLRPRRTE